MNSRQHLLLLLVGTFSLFVVVTMCTLEELGKGLLPMSQRMSAGDELFPGGPKVKTATIGEIFANESAGQIPTTDDMGLARELVLRHVPFVISNMSAVKRLGSKWTPAYLLSHAGSVKMDIDVYRNRRFRYVHRETMRRMAAADPVRAQLFAKSSGYEDSTIDTMARFIAGSAERTMYGTMLSNETLLDDQIREVFDELVPLVKELEAIKPKLRMGFHDLDFCTHLDGSANFLAQVAGVKHIVLWNPLQEEKLYWERDSDHPYFRQSHVWPRDNGKEEFPEFHTSEALQTVLYPGDVVFIPPLWFHYLETQQTRFWLNVNMWAFGDMCPVNP